MGLENPEGIKIIRNEDIAHEKVVQPELTVDSMIDFITPRAFGTGVASALIASSLAYIESQSIAIPFYTYGLGGAVVGATFHCGARIVQDVRQEDDMINYATSGVVHGVIYGVGFKGLRRAGIYGIGAGIAAGAYYTISSFLYESSREAWVRSRRSNIREPTPVKILQDKMSMFELRPEGLPPIPNIYTPVADDDTSLVGRARRYLQSLRSIDPKDDSKK